MEAVTIHDADPSGPLSFDLTDILQVAGARARSSTWRCRSVECVGPLADVLHEASDDGHTLSGDGLLDAAAGVTQVIDGAFTATGPEGGEPWLVVRAVDSSLYVVVTDDRELLARLRARFRDVRDSPGDAGAG